MLLNPELRGDMHNLLLMGAQVGFSTAVVLSPFEEKNGEMDLQHIFVEYYRLPYQDDPIFPSLVGLKPKAE